MNPEAGAIDCEVGRNFAHFRDDGGELMGKCQLRSVSDTLRKRKWVERESVSDNTEFWTWEDGHNIALFIQTSKVDASPFQIFVDCKFVARIVIQSNV